MMTPRRERLHGGGMGAGPVAVLLLGRESRTSTRTARRRTWATRRRTSATSCPTASALTAHSRPATGSSAGRAGPTGLPPRHRSSSLPGSALTGSPGRGPASGSGATAHWDASGTAACRTEAPGAGAGAAGGETAGRLPDGTCPERATAPPRGSVSFLLCHVPSPPGR